MVVGGSWFLREYDGIVLLHSRRSFTQVTNLDESKLTCLLSAIKSMTSNKVNRVIFEVEVGDLVGVISHPRA